MGNFPQILNQQGVSVTWKKRQEGTPDPETGQPTITWVEEQIKAVIQQREAAELVFEPGYSSKDYIRIFVIADIKHLDRIVWQGADWEILPPQSYFFGDSLEYRIALCRRVIP
jgi:hypothetical protein